MAPADATPSVACVQISRTGAFGPSLVLGKATTTKALTTLTSWTGTPLALNPKKGSPPLKVSSDVKVKNLDGPGPGGGGLTCSIVMPTEVCSFVGMPVSIN
jgi:hypothetical protein